MALPAPPFPRRIAAIDVGTNTALLLVAEVAADGAMTPLHEAERFIRLGEGVDATGRVTAAALHRLREALLAYRAVAGDFGVAEVVVGATSASRDARNQAALIDFVRRETGLRYEILSGEDEAAWSFLGGLSALDDLAGPCAVVDVGGGSTEIAVGDRAGGVTFRRSLPLGSVRLTERFFAALPPEAAAVERFEAVVARSLEAAALPLDAALPLVGVDGTVVSLALLRAGASTWAELGAAPVSLSAADVHAWRRRLLAMPREEILALNPAVMTGRADVFPAGVLLLDAVMRRFGLPACRVSPRSLRHGLALRWARQSASG